MATKKPPFQLDMAKVQAGLANGTITPEQVAAIQAQLDGVNTDMAKTGFTQIKEHPWRFALDAAAVAAPMLISGLAGGAAAAKPITEGVTSGQPSAAPGPDVAGATSSPADGGGGNVNLKGAGASTGGVSLKSLLPMLGLQAGSDALGAILGPKPDAPRRSYQNALPKSDPNYNYVNPGQTLGNTTHMTDQLISSLAKKAQGGVNLRVPGYSVPGLPFDIGGMNAQSPYADTGGDLSSLVDKILANKGAGVA